MKIDPNAVCIVEPSESAVFTPPVGELLGFVQHPKHGVLLVNYQAQDNDSHFVHFLEPPGRCEWMCLPSNTRVLSLKTATFQVVT